MNPTRAFKDSSYFNGIELGRNSRWDEFRYLVEVYGPMGDRRNFSSDLHVQNRRKQDCFLCGKIERGRIVGSCDYVRKFLRSRIVGEQGNQNTIREIMLPCVDRQIDTVNSDS